MNKSEHLTKLILGYETPTNLNDDLLFRELLKKGILTSNIDGPYWDRKVTHSMSDVDKLQLILKLDKLKMKWWDIDAI